METKNREFDPGKMKAARHRAGLSQLELQTASGIPVTMIREYEQGKSDPSVTRLFIIADTLGCSADELAS